MLIGKAEPFRSAGGKAALRETQPPSLLTISPANPSFTCYREVPLNSGFGARNISKPRHVSAVLARHHKVHRKQKRSYEILNSSEASQPSPHSNRRGLLRDTYA